MNITTLDIDVSALQQLPADDPTAVGDLAGAELAKCNDTCNLTCMWTCSFTWW
jgi:hypothetical protein